MDRGQLRVEQVVRQEKQSCKERAEVLLGLKQRYKHEWDEMNVYGMSDWLTSRWTELMQNLFSFVEQTMEQLETEKLKRKQVRVIK